MDSTNKYLHAIALKSIYKIGDQLARNLISYFKNAELVFKASRTQLLKVQGMGENTADAILHFKDFDLIYQELEQYKKQNIEILLYSDETYPYRLRECSDAPLFLLKKGNADLNNLKSVAVVGTRNASPYGKEFCYKLAEALRECGALVISGLANGIDTHAHKAALKHQLPTVAVLAHGFKHLSPPGNKDLSEEICAQNGALITEHRAQVPPAPEQFPKRNRIVAGMCDALVIVESGVKGGAMITAEIAWSYNRELFALPGKISDYYSLGCNRLINNQRALCIESPQTLIEYLGWKSHNPSSGSLEFNIQNLNPYQQNIFKLLRSGEKHIDTLHLESGIPLAELSHHLLEMEFSNIVRSLPGKIYKLAL